MDEDLVLGLYVLLPLVIGGLLVLLAQGLRARTRPPGTLRLISGNLLVLLLLLSLGVLGGEIYYRFFSDTTDSLGYTKLNQRWFDRHWQLNSADFRDNIPYSLKLTPGTRRITFLGDSFAAGHGVKNVDDRFANRLRQAHPEWEIHVLAQPGYDTGDEIQQLRDSLAQHYQLDVVVLVYCLNDVADMFPEWGEAVRRVRDRAAQSAWLLRNSYFVNDLYCRFYMRRDAGVKRYFEFIAQGYRDGHWDRQQQRLRELRDLVQSHGGRLLVVTFPFFQGLGPQYAYYTIHDQLNQCWRMLGVAHLDLLDTYRNIPSARLIVNANDPHPNEYAHALAAEAIGKFLEEQLAGADKHSEKTIGGREAKSRASGNTTAPPINPGTH
ncbi:MAG TPA: SGNH/GDSL hydrolase family protein [Candidatus Acidoferrum sp.]|nr:SGNH/GDSL hydrolase family protein [Candidatus Acidoferrum sp.]